MFSDRKSTIILIKEKHLTENPHNIMDEGVSKACFSLPTPKSP